MWGRTDGAWILLLTSIYSSFHNVWGKITSAWKQMAGRMQQNHVPGKITSSSGKKESPTLIWQVPHWKLKKKKNRRTQQGYLLRLVNQKNWGWGYIDREAGDFIRFTLFSQNREDGLQRWSHKHPNKNLRDTQTHGYRDRWTDTDSYCVKVDTERTGHDASAV